MCTSAITPSSFAAQFVAFAVSVPVGTHPLQLNVHTKPHSILYGTYESGVRPVPFVRIPRLPGTGSQVREMFFANVPLPDTAEKPSGFFADYNDLQRTANATIKDIEPSLGDDEPESRRMRLEREAAAHCGAAENLDYDSAMNLFRSAVIYSVMDGREYTILAAMRFYAASQIFTALGRHDAAAMSAELAAHVTEQLGYMTFFHTTDDGGDAALYGTAAATAWNKSLSADDDAESFVVRMFQQFLYDEYVEDESVQLALLDASRNFYLRNGSPITASYDSLRIAWLILRQGVVYSTMDWQAIHENLQRAIDIWGQHGFHPEYLDEAKALSAAASEFASARG